MTVFVWHCVKLTQTQSMCGTGPNYADLYELKVVLLSSSRSKDDDVIKQYESGTMTCKQEWITVVRHFEDFGVGVRYVQITERAKDVEHWGGHFGARVKRPVVRIRAPSEGTALHCMYCTVYSTYTCSHTSLGTCRSHGHPKCNSTNADSVGRTSYLAPTLYDTAHARHRSHWRQQRVVHRNLQNPSHSYGCCTPRHTFHSSTGPCRNHTTDCSLHCHSCTGSRCNLCHNMHPPIDMTDMHTNVQKSGCYCSLSRMLQIYSTI